LLGSSFDVANNTVPAIHGDADEKRLLISTVAALATVYQSRLIANQLSATIWPYLSVQAGTHSLGARDV